MSPHRSGLHLHLRLRRRPQSLLTRANPRDSIPLRCDQEKSHERHLKIWGEWLRWGRWKAATATAALRECSSRICSHTTATGDKQLGKTEELRSCRAEKLKPQCQLSCSPAGPSGCDCDCGSKEQLLMMLVLLAAPKHVLPVMAMHLLKALCVRAVNPSAPLSSAPGTPPAGRPAHLLNP